MWFNAIALFLEEEEMDGGRMLEEVLKGSKMFGGGKGLQRG